MYPLVCWSASCAETESEADIPIFVPVPFQELSSIQHYTPEEQLLEFTAALKEQFPRHCFIKIHQKDTQPMLVPFVKRFYTAAKNLAWYEERLLKAARALAPVAGSTDPAERVAFACTYLLRGVHAYQGSVRAMISHTIAAPARSPARPGIRFGLIDHALAPFQDPGGPAYLPPAAMTDLKNGLAIVVSAEALFVLTDLCGLSPADAITSATRAATTLTKAAFAGAPAR